MIVRGRLDVRMNGFRKNARIVTSKNAKMIHVRANVKILAIFVRMEELLPARNAKINGPRKNAKSVTRKSVRRTRNVLRTVRRPASYVMIALLHLIYFTNCLKSLPAK